MSIVTFWSSGKEETGKTASIVAIATHLAIEHNYRILVMATTYKDRTLTRSFWKEKKQKSNNLGIFGPNTNVAVEEGIDGLARIMRSNKLSPDIITNYTKIIFKDRLEIIPSFTGDPVDYKNIEKMYPDIINLANSYYDLVLVDLSKIMDPQIQLEILQNSNIVVASLTQRLSSIENFIELRNKQPIFASKKTLLLIGRYDKYSKYTIKNISRYMKEKNKVSTIPYNTLFFEACEESSVLDLFLSMRRMGEEDRNGFFMAEVKRTSENIIYRLQDLQMKL